MTARECHGTTDFYTRTEEDNPSGRAVRYRCRRCMYSVAFIARGRSANEIDGHGAAAIRAHIRARHRAVTV